MINIVFLMLIFFLVAAQVASPLDPELELAKTDDQALVPPPDAVVLAQDGSLSFRGAPTTVAEAFAILSAEGGDEVEVRLLPDARSDAATLVSTATELRSAGASAVYIITEQALR
ncbi:MAG: biopolymer transporter ExbD [Pseudomonadota bacterium]